MAGGPERYEELGGAMANIGITFAPMFWGFMAAITELVAESGKVAFKKSGTGWKPTTLSTTNFNGRGASNIRGIDSRLSRKIPAILGQCGLDWANTRR